MPNCKKPNNIIIGNIMKNTPNIARFGSLDSVRLRKNKGMNINAIAKAIINIGKSANIAVPIPIKILGIRE